MLGGAFSRVKKNTSGKRESVSYLNSMEIDERKWLKSGNAEPCAR